MYNMQTSGHVPMVITMQTRLPNDQNNSLHFVVICLIPNSIKSNYILGVLIGTRENWLNKTYYPKMKTYILLSYANNLVWTLYAIF